MISQGENFLQRFKSPQVVYAPLSIRAQATTPLHKSSSASNIDLLLPPSRLPDALLLHISVELIHLGFGHLAVVRGDEQNVLGLEVGVNERQLVHVGHGLEELPAKVAHHLQGEGPV